MDCETYESEEFFCPLIEHEVDECICYDLQMVAWRMIKKSILQDYEFPVDASMVTKERAKKYCEHCEFDQISGPPTRVGLTEVSQVV